jgi:hypothetical protein
MAQGGFPGDFDPYIHGVNDTMDIDDATGVFSIDVSLIKSPSEPSLIHNSTWQDSRSWQLLLLWNKRDGIMSGENS